MEPCICFEQVWKKYRKGETHDSLRDLIPSIMRRLRHNGDASQSLQEREFWSIRDVSFQVNKGESFGIIGHNGAGKSTILKLLSKILRPTQGRVAIQGRLNALIEVGAGFHQDLTGRENIYLNGAILGMKKREIDGKLEQIVEFSELSEFIDTPVKRYSSGMYARLGFSVAAHTEPEVFLVDEVLSVGDVGFQAKCMAKLQELISGGTTIVFVSHKIKQVAKLCHRVMLLNQGMVQYLGEPHVATQMYYDQVMARSGKKFQSHPPSTLGIVVTPVDRSGARIASIPFGAPIRLGVACVLPPEFPKSHINIKIGNHQNQDYIELSTERSGLTLKPGQTNLTCQLEPCRLLPGTYRLHAVLMDAIAGQTLDFFPYQADLVIDMPDAALARTLPTPESAILDVPTRWEVEQDCP